MVKTCARKVSRVLGGCWQGREMLVMSGCVEIRGQCRRLVGLHMRHIGVEIYIDI